MYKTIEFDVIIKIILSLATLYFKYSFFAKVLLRYTCKDATKELIAKTKQHIKITSLRVPKSKKNQVLCRIQISYIEVIIKICN